MLFNKHKDMIKNEELTGEFSNHFFFLPSITDKSEELNRYLNNISSTPIDSARFLDQGHQSETHYLKLYGEKKKLMKECVVCTLKHTNLNLMRNAGGILSKMDKER